MSTSSHNPPAVALGVRRTGRGSLTGTQSAHSRQAAQPLGDLARARIVAALRACFNCLVLNLALVLTSVPVVTLPIAVNAAAVALDRWRVDGEDRVVREFLHALRSRHPGPTALAIGAPFAAIAIAVEEVHFFLRGGAPVNWACLGFGAASLVVAISSTSFVIVLRARFPEMPLPDLWSEGVRLAVANVLVSSPLFAIEYTAAVLLGFLDPALVLIGLPLAFLSLVRLTADAGTRRTGYGRAPTTGNLGARFRSKTS
ncbi:MAG TPA: hypothetical protein VME20_03595 [Acidimicrobiales bacterium]|nr:hypothetical protein [Acidimicrobiales bacterium]